MKVRVNYRINTFADRGWIEDLRFLVERKVADWFGTGVTTARQVHADDLFPLVAPHLHAYGGPRGPYAAWMMRAYFNHVTRKNLAIIR